jgi:hypothetical protein
MRLAAYAAASAAQRLSSNGLIGQVIAPIDRDGRSRKAK